MGAGRPTNVRTIKVSHQIQAENGTHQLLDVISTSITQYSPIRL